MSIDLAAEMAAARQRRAEQTIRALREARVVAVRAAARPDATDEDLEALARSFYPRLSEEQRAMITDEVRAGWRGGGPVGYVAPVVAEAAVVDGDDDAGEDDAADDEPADEATSGE